MVKHDSLLEVTNLKVYFKTKGGMFSKAVDGVDLAVSQGEILGLVGESGGGKTVLSMALLRLISSPGFIEGKILLHGRDLLKMKPSVLRSVRGKEIAMIFQNPQSSLNPVFSIKQQIIAAIRLHRRDLSNAEAYEEAINLLRLVKIPDPEKRINDYPHQLSIGMCQRAMIAIALSCQPKLLIADEPTASLDVTIQAQIMDLLLEIREKIQMAILLVSHDLGVIARMCDRSAVMYLGRIVESAHVAQLYNSPFHPYTQALLQSVPVGDPGKREKIAKIKGDIPSSTNIPSGCRFRTRCPCVFDQCSQVDPVLKLHGKDNSGNHFVACHLY